MRGVALATQSEAACAALDRAIDALAAHHLDAGDHLRAARAADPLLVLADVIEGFGAVLLGRRDLWPHARACHARAQAQTDALGAPPRESALCAALGAAACGDPLACIEHLDAATREAPRDLLAVKLSHAMLFVVGDSEGMRRRAELAASAFVAGVPGRDRVLGMLAFALVETGELERAGRVGREATHLARGDAWAAHAVAHVMEMRGRVREGEAWLSQNEDILEGCHNFRGHVHWHHALFELALGRADAALHRYDVEVAPYLGRGEELGRDYRDLANASSLLFRMERQGIGVADRWEHVADAAAAHWDDHGLAFADTHRVLALAGAGRHADAERLVASLRASMLQLPAHTRAVDADVGAPVAEATHALFCGDPQRAYALLSASRPQWPRLGGSLAQRDTYELLHLHAALACGRFGVARELLRARERSGRSVRWASDALLETRAT